MPTPLLTRRRFLKTCASALAAGSIPYTYGREFAVHNLGVKYVTIPIPGLAPQRNNTRLVVVSDFHAGRVSMSYLQHSLNRAANLKPDFLLIPGDFVDSQLSQLDNLCKILAPIAARIPTYGSTGNHDYAHHWTDLAFSNTVCSALQNAGVKMLRNNFHQPTPGPGELCFVGLEDLWSKQLDATTLARAPQNASTILLSHNPDSYESVAPYRWHLMLCGHTHGGQVCVPGVGPIFIPVKHRERAAGLFHLDPAQPHRALYVTRGVGHLLKIRLCCPPEITCITLVSSPTTSA